MSAPQQSLSERLGEVQVGLRPDLEFSRLLQRGEPYYVGRDPISFQSHRFTAEDYQILMALTGEKTLAEQFKELLDEGTLEADQEDGFYQFVLKLNQMGFMNLPISDGKALYERFVKRRYMERKSKVVGILFMRLPLFNPDDFLNRTMRYVAPLFTPAAFFLYCIMLVIAGTILFGRWADLGNPLNSLLATKNFAFTWISFVGLKVIHEFGHAYACKRFGGKVPEMGAFFMVGTPCAYMDASDSWGFPSALHRIIVSLGGMYFESIAAFIALLVWNSTPPGPMNSFAYQTMVLAGLMAVVVNLNPLMRYDGYYIACDVLGFPNLRAMAVKYTQGIFKKYVLRLEVPRSDVSFFGKVILFTYGVSASIYKVVLTLSICGMIAMKIYLAGMLIGFVYFGSTVYGAASKLFKYLCFGDETAPVRHRAICVAVVILVIIPASVALVPVSQPIEITGVVSTDKDQQVFAKTSGFLTEIERQPGDAVEAGAVICKLSNPETVAGLQRAEAELELLQRQYHHEYAQDPSLAAITAQRIEQTRATLRNLTDDQRNLTVRSPVSGHTTHDAKLNELGRFVREGEPLATVSLNDDYVIKALATEEEITDAGPLVGQEIEFRMCGEAETPRTAEVTDVDVRGSRIVNLVQLTHLAGGAIAVSPSEMEAAQPYFNITVSPEAQQELAIKQGMTAVIRFDGPTRPYGQHLYRRFLQFLNRLKSSQ